MGITTLSSRQFNQDSSRAKKAAESGPVVITDRGRPAHVLLTFDDYRRLSRQPMSLADALAMPDGDHIEVEFPRSRELPREVDLS
jgi:prevent-host-death family protein